MLSAFFPRKPPADKIKFDGKDALSIVPQCRNGFTTVKSDYGMLQHIAVGSAAQIDVTRHKPTGRVVVVRTQSKRQRSLEMLKNEADLAFHLSHPHVAETYAIFEDKCHVYMVTEYIEGCDLFDFVAKAQGGLSEQEAHKIMLQLIDAVAYLHAQDIAHRDVKPENIIVGPDGVKLIDFGLSFRLRGPKTSPYPGALVGTVNYLAPELVKVLDGRAHAEWSRTVDWRKVDVWALGVTLFCMTMNRFPWLRACSVTSKEYRAYEEGYAAATDPWADTKLSDGARKILRRALDPHPDSRATLPELQRILCQDWFSLS